MRILVAGGSGVLGSRVVLRLVAAGHTVWATTRSEGRTASIAASGAGPLIMDALDADSVSRAVDESKPELIMHQLTGGRDQHRRRRTLPSSRLGTGARHRRGWYGRVRSGTDRGPSRLEREGSQPGLDTGPSQLAIQPIRNMNQLILADRLRGGAMDRPTWHTSHGPLKRRPDGPDPDRPRPDRVACEAEPECAATSARSASG